MPKKVISALLAVMLLVSMLTIGIVSVSAEADENGAYVPSETVQEEVGVNRYFFYMPDDWYNDFTSSAGVYWWEGTDACGAMGEEGSLNPAWPGYKMHQADVKNVWYVDVPKDVNTIIFNNALDGTNDPDDPRYVQAVQTVDIGSEYYDPGESALYPDGTESFNNMIYVIDPSQTSESVTGKLTYGGEWYYYHNNGEYDTNPDGAEPTTPVVPWVPDETEPSSATEPVPTETEPVPTETEPVPTETEPVPTETEPVPTETTPDDKQFTVTAKSNMAEPVSQTYNEQDKTVTVTYLMKTDRKVCNGQWSLMYDPSVLKFNRAAMTDEEGYEICCPIVEKRGGYVWKLFDYEAMGIANGNFTNVSTFYDFTNEDINKDILFQGTFDIVGDYTKDTEIDFDLQVMSIGEKDEYGQVSYDVYVQDSILNDKFTSNCETKILLSEATPLPTETEPVPTETTPVPTETEPVPTETTPVPTETEPVPTETTPVPTETEPVPTETTPVPTETVPVPTETEPTDVPKQFTVTAKSNFTDPVTQTYNEDDKTVTVTYYLTSDQKLVNGQWTFWYDPSVLKFNKEATLDENGNESVMPIIDAVGGSVTRIFNLESMGIAKGNFSDISKLYDFSNEDMNQNVFFQATFDIVGDYTKDTEVNLELEVLTAGSMEDDGTLNRTVYIKDSIVSDTFAENFTTKASLSDGSYVPPVTEPVPTETTPVPTETEPVPTETEPVPTETEPVPTETQPASEVEPTTATEPGATDATETVPAATGATSSVATADTPTTSGGASSTTGGGTVQTSDTSAAMILFVILSAATAFIIVVRKREYNK